MMGGLSPAPASRRRFLPGLPRGADGNAQANRPSTVDNGSPDLERAESAGIPATSCDKPIDCYLEVSPPEGPDYGFDWTMPRPFGFADMRRPSR